MENALIFVVEDNESNIKLIKLLLERAGYRVGTAEDAETAKTEIEAVQPALILMDIQLPGMDGLSLTTILKHEQATQDIPIIALTAYAMKGDKERALAAGCDDYISKPVERLELLALIHKRLEEAKASVEKLIASQSF